MNEEETICEYARRVLAEEPSKQMWIGGFWEDWQEEEWIRKEIWEIGHNIGEDSQNASKGTIFLKEIKHGDIFLLKKSAGAGNTLWIHAIGLVKSQDTGEAKKSYKIEWQEKFDPSVEVTCPNPDYGGGNWPGSLKKIMKSENREHILSNLEGKGEAVEKYRLVK